MFQNIRKVIFKILLGKDYYDFLINNLMVYADKYYQDYKKWKPLFNMDINLNGWCYDYTVGILEKLGEKYSSKKEN